MGFEQYIWFVVVTAVFLLSPGPAVMLQINNGIRYGVRRSVIAVLGNMLAFQILIVLSALGLGALLTASAELFDLCKYLGAAYLLYLGVRLWRAAPVANSAEVNTDRPGDLFRRAFLITASNPKALIYVSALLPQFVDPAQPLVTQFSLLALSCALVQFLVFMLYVVLAARARNWLSQPQRAVWFNRFGGLTFFGFAIALGLSSTRA